MNGRDFCCDGCGKEGVTLGILFGHVSNYDIPEYERPCTLCATCVEKQNGVSGGYFFTPYKPKKTECPHGEHIIDDVVSVIDKSLRLYYMFKGVEDLDASHHRVIQEYITWALEHKGAS